MMVQLRTQLTRNYFGQMALICMIACCLFIVGCSSPTEVTIEQELRDRLLATSTKYTDPAKASPIIQVTQTPSSVEQDLTPELRQELDGFSGPTAYRDEPLNVGSDLLGREDPRVVQMSLQKVIHDTTQHNLTLKRARLIPAIDDQAIIQAEAAFDAVYFANVNWGISNTPQFATAFGVSGSNTRTTTTSFSTGIRKPLTTGGQISFETGTTRTDTSPTNFSSTVAYRPFALISLEQPLLRNFGSDVNRSQIQLAENAKRQDVQSLRQRILEANLQAEQEYWNLYLARHQLMVRTRLLEGIQGDRDHIKQREIIDADPQSVTQANSEVETARANVIRARQLVREQSDRIKRLINSDALPLTDETLVTPIDDPITVPIDFSMLDAVTAAMRNRPELRTALLAIEDASIRQRVADNQKLPILNLTASVQFNDLHQHNGGLTQSDYIDFAIGGQFEAPLGNRAAEAAYSQALLARRDAVLNYQDAAQGVVLEIKNAMRELVTSYDLIGARRAARRAAAENIRAIEAQEGAGAAMTPTFLDRKLRSRQTLAEAEIQEMNAIVSYNVAISQFYLAMGTLLERNGIEFADHLASK